jgi:hypothetical protein
MVSPMLIFLLLLNLSHFFALSFHATSFEGFSTSSILIKDRPVIKVLEVGKCNYDLLSVVRDLTAKLVALRVKNS